MVDGNPIHIETMVVTASRVPQPLADTTMRTQILDSDTIERMQSRDLAEALRLVPGLQLREIHGKTGKEVQLQGFNGDRVLVLVNGQPVSATTGSTVDVTQLSALDVDRIEIVPGATSSLYGSAAMGGVVNIITNEDPSRLRLLGEFGSYGDDELSDGLAPQRHYLASAAGQWGGWNGQISSDQRRSSETDFNPDTYASNGFGGSKTNSGASIGYDWNSNRLDNGGVRVGFQHYLEDLQQRLSETVNKHEDLVRRRLDLSSHQNTNSGRWSLALLAEQQQDATLQRNRDSSILAGLLERKAHYRQQKASLEWASLDDLLSLSRGPTLNLVAGIEYFHEDITQHKRQLKLGDLADYATDEDDGSDGVVVTDSVTYTDIGDDLLELSSGEVAGNRSSTDVFSQSTLSFKHGDQEFDLGLGLRLQRDSDFGNHLAPTLSSRQSWPLNNGWQLQTRQSLGMGYRVGNLKERYYEFDHSIYGYKVIGNPDLQPEQSRSTQLSISLSDQQRWHVEMSAFQNRIGDLIEAVDSGDVDTSNGSYVVIYQYANIDRARTRGFELSSQWRFNRYLQQRASFSYLDAWNLGADLPLPNRSRQQAKIAWLWDPTASLSLNLMTEYQGSFYSSVNTDDRTTERSPGYWQWDLTASLTSFWYSHQQRWFTGIKNLTDSVREGDDSYDRRPTQGRYIYAGFDLRY
ncbi:TonB-dependent receptor plug domain-containing protein [Oceanobacter mangrovi]|uniref:TonB-dependent receptor plug domain-containing protein n=1 Tax=Oceanobacter mangrovi TaxID=2862510 RepID=UPI001C8D84EB|nr:TonB-dependent receptor [Oceanobacter mangrovi]